ncbi:DNA mismatch repair endonuclease MutL [Macrococcus armenti]|uniref:DNA mismatch repair endonuclease MutL n=1 Tax=Macrococcus armenti TaxID=2875764 RepID=UPI001CCD54C2|nr:DNA mismatch repair endonuclease MutL [Macrococcus armenti]UBH14092.1 DNA mismatch repair endonuclease MutL [Macrococcus armenti]
MGVIKALHSSISNKIAAGEVIERPQSVVKELVENAIDAGSTVITVEVVEAGLNKIKVTDNGSGIQEDDLELMFMRHATSKIENDHDLFHIRSLGFRGEALASIASVSKVRVITCFDGEIGRQIDVIDGEIVNKTLAHARQGTEISVEALFYNTPARLKYVKSLHTELGKITDIMNRFIMSFPHIRFTLVSDEKVLINSSGNGNMQEAMSKIYGMKIAQDLVEINGETGDYKVTGYIAKPEHTRSNRHYMSLFINGRYIKNFMLTKAILEGYHTLLPVGRFPVLAIHITMDPALVDVNVHPTKQEVRLSKEPQLMALISQLIKEKIWQQNLIPKVEKKSVLEQFEQQKFEYDLKNKSHKDELNQIVQESNESVEATEPILQKEETKQILNYENNDRDKANDSNSVKELFRETIAFQDKTADEPIHSGDNSERTESVHDEKQLPERSIPYMEVVGQVHGTYIIAQNDEGMYMIDQHAAQERIKYEYFKARIGDVGMEMQSLLIPVTINLSTDEAINIQKIKPLLEDIGITLEHFGGNDYVINEVPVWFPEQYEETLQELIDFAFDNKRIDLNKFREETAIMMSCKKSIKANHYLRIDDMNYLIQELAETKEPYTCPHGRPIIIQFTTYELEKLFKRVM